MSFKILLQRETERGGAEEEEEKKKNHIFGLIAFGMPQTMSSIAFLFQFLGASFVVGFE